MNTNELLEDIKRYLAINRSVNSYPSVPVEIQGIVAADAFDAGDCMGILTKVKVPKSGILYSATFWDMDDEGSEVDLEVFKNEIPQIASDQPWAPTDETMRSFVTHLAFASFIDHGTSRTAELNNIGKAYTAPLGYFWIQAVTPSTPTIAAGNMPRFQLQIIPTDAN